MRIKPSLSHEQKEEVVKEYASKHNLEVMVETGVFDGKMISGTKDFFRETHSVELIKEYYDKAVEKFKDCTNVNLYNGDSSLLLNDISILKDINCLIWLDAHDGKQSPVLKELEVIFSMSENEHIILIDDMRNFDHRKGYPNISKVKELILLKRPHWDIEISDDIMRAGKNIKM